MYNPQELQRKAQLNIHGVDTNAQTSLNNNNPPKQENEQHWLVRGLATVGNFVSNIVEGAVKSIEGIVDTGAMLVGLFGADVDEFVSYDFTADIFGTDEEGEGLLEWSWGRNLADVSYLDNENIVNQIAEGVGGLLPTVAIGILTGGTSLAGTAASAGAKAASIGAKVANVASKVAFVAGAAGNASESALQEGATYGQALGYGALSGAIEAGTEMIGGRVFGSATKIDNTLLGKLAVKTGTDKFISKGVGKAVYSFASEGLEEVVADLLDPVNKRITGVDSEAKVDWAQLPKTFFIGGAVGAVLDGIQGGASAIYNNKRGGKHYVRVSENLENIANTNKALAYLQESKSISQDKLDKAVIRNTERTMDSLEEISKEFQAMTAEQRKSAFETLRESTSFIDNALNSDGTIKESVFENYSDVVNNGAKYNVSSNLLYNTTEVENDITEINKQKELNIELSDTIFDAEQRKNFAKINRNINLISKKTGTELELVVFKDNKDVNAFIDNNRIYIGEEHLKDGKWAKYLSHEISHFAKNSKEFKSFAEFIAKDEKALMDAFSKIINSRYDFTYSEVKSIVERIKNGKVGLLTAKENAIYDELVAHVAEDLFTNEESINRLARENTTIAQKILNAIKDFLSIFKGTNADRDTVVRLRKAEILFEKALDSIGKEAKTVRQNFAKASDEYKRDKKEYENLAEDKKEVWLKDKGYTAEDFADDVLDDGNELDNSDEIRYSIKENLQGIHIEDKQEYAKLSQALASKNGNKPKKVEYVFTDKNFYVVKDNRLGHFTPVLQVGIVGNEELIDSIKENIKNGSHRKATTIAEWVGIVQSGTRSDNRDNDSITRRKANGYPNELYGEESESNARRNTSQNSRNSKKVVRYDFENGIVTYKDGTTAKFSLKDSDGNTLTKEQQEFFKDSKVRDSEGNLMVVYHGTNNEFTTFKQGEKSGWLGKGIYFTESREYARENGAKIVKAYLNVKNPFMAESIDHFGVFSELKEKFPQINELNISEVIKEAGYDGIVYTDWDKGKIILVYDSNQIKLTTNKNPTKAHDIRFSLSSKEFIDGVNQETVNNFVEKSKSNTNEIDVLEYAKTTIKLVKDIENDISDISEYVHVLRDNDIRHIFNSHGTQTNEKYPISIVDIQNIPYITANYDKIYYRVSNKGLPSLLYIFALPDNNVYYIEQAVQNYGGKKLLINKQMIKTGVDDIPSNYLSTILSKQKKSDFLADLSKARKEHAQSVNHSINSIFNSNENVNTNTEKTSKSHDIRFSRSLSDGQVKKQLADYTRKKVYSKVEAERTINTILESNFGLEDYNVEISGKTKAEAVDELWKNFNTLDAGKRTGAANKIADYIIDNAVMESYFAEAENDVYIETIDSLRPFLHSIDLSHIREEIKYRGDNSAYLLWGKKKGESGMTADQVAQKLGEQGIRINAETEADIFFEIDEMYRKAVKELKVKTEEQVKDYLSAEDRKQLRGDIAKAILRGYDENGKKSKFAEIVEEQSKNARKWKELYYEEKGRNSAENKLLYQVQKIRDIHFGDFQNASQADNKIFRGSIEKLSAIKNRGDLNKSGTRRIIAGLNTWYNEENPLLNGRYSQEISTALNQIASGEGNLTTAEIRNLTDVVAYFRHFIETANKIYRAGKYIDAMPIAEDYVRKLHDNTKVKLGFFGNLFDKTFNNRKYNYMETFNDPMTIVRYMDKYDNGFFTQTMEEFRDCAVNAAILEMDLNAPLEDFYKKHKTFLKDAGNRMINYNGVQIPAIDAFNCYMALNREEGMLKLAWSGFSWIDEKGNTNRVDGFVTDSDFDYETVKFLANEVQSELEKQFTETDLEYIKIAEDLFNNRCKELKKERDLSRYGYSNVSDNYYIPIAVANVAKSIDVDGWQSEVDRVSNLSFNKATVKGAKNEMLIEPLNVVLSRHLRGIAQYYHLSNAVDNYNIIYNMDTGGNKNKVISVKSESKNVWLHGEAYMKEMLSDIQGIKKGESSKMFGAVRSSYAKYQLGANPKVWFTQLSSFFASTSILDFSSVVKGLAINTEDVDKYCRLAELRDSDDTAARAQGNLGEIKGDNVVSKTSDLLMKPIGIMDRFVVRKLFGACQVQVQKNTGLKVGTEENKVKAGELLKKVILETQQNAIATERSKAMRSTSELMRTLTMFTSDSMKVIGRVIDAYGEITMLKARKRITTDDSELARLDAEIKRANKKAVKATASLVVQAVFMALIAQGFKTLYNKDDEEENIVENMTVDAIGNLFGGLPLFKDVYAKIIEGYDFDGYQYSAINDMLDSAVNIFDLVGDIFSGTADSRDVMKNIKNLSYAIGQLFGIPVRNVYNVITGLINRVSPEMGYKINDAFYKQSYSKDLKRAIKYEDEEMIATIAGLIMDENIGSFENSATRKEINRLIGAEYDVLPQSVPSSVTINEEAITLTGSQKNTFKEVYSKSISAVDKLVASKGYRIAGDDAKAKAVKYVYKYYYYEAQQKALNVELDSKLYLFGQVIPVETLALILAEAPLLAEKSTNKKAAVLKYLQGAKLTATQKYMLMGYFGYKNTYGQSAVESVINKTSLSKEQKKLLLEKCGY